MQRLDDGVMRTRPRGARGPGLAQDRPQVGDVVGQDDLPSERGRVGLDVVQAAVERAVGGEAAGAAAGAQPSQDRGGVAAVGALAEVEGSRRALFPLVAPGPAQEALEVRAVVHRDAVTEDKDAGQGAVGGHGRERAHIHAARARRGQG